MVQLALEEIAHRHTMILIAHRFSSIRLAQRIVVLAKGRIVEHGSHATLLDRKGTYYQLYSQAHGGRVAA